MNIFKPFLSLLFFSTLSHAELPPLHQNYLIEHTTPLTMCSRSSTHLKFVRLHKESRKLYVSNTEFCGFVRDVEKHIEALKEFWPLRENFGVVFKIIDNREQLNGAFISFSLSSELNTPSHIVIQVNQRSLEKHSGQEEIWTHEYGHIIFEQFLEVETKVNELIRSGLENINATQDSLKRVIPKVVQDYDSINDQFKAIMIKIEEIKKPIAREEKRLTNISSSCPYISTGKEALAKYKTEHEPILDKLYSELFDVQGHLYNIQDGPAIEDRLKLTDTGWYRIPCITCRNPDIIISDIEIIRSPIFSIEKNLFHAENNLDFSCPNSGRALSAEMEHLAKKISKTVNLKLNAEFERLFHSWVESDFSLKVKALPYFADTLSNTVALMKLKSSGHELFADFFAAIFHRDLETYSKSNHDRNFKLFYNTPHYQEFNLNEKSRLRDFDQKSSQHYLSDYFNVQSRYHYFIPARADLGRYLSDFYRSNETKRDHLHRLLSGFKNLFQKSIEGDFNVQIRDVYQKLDLSTSINSSSFLTSLRLAGYKFEPKLVSHETFKSWCELDESRCLNFLNSHFDKKNEDSFFLLIPHYEETSDKLLEIMNSVYRLPENI